MYLKDTVRKVVNYIYIKQGRNSARYCECGNEPVGVIFSFHCVYIHGKVKIVPVHDTKTYRESRGIAPPILNLGTRRG